MSQSAQYDRTISVVLCLVFTFVQFSRALQVGGGFGRADVGTLRVRVIYSDDRATTVRARVRLFSPGNGEVVAEGYCDEAGAVEFSGVQVGIYHLIVSGEGLQETDSGPIEVDARKSSQSVFITVRRTGENGLATGHNGGASSVSVSQLKIPAEARNKLNEANQLMVKSDWAGAISRLNQAIAIYPAYAEAYNNLASADAHLERWNQARESLQKAISLDDHFAPALVNLAKLEERDKKYVAAETLLTKASALDPSNAETLMLLCRTQLLGKHFDAAIATARRAHAMPHQGYAIVHYIAARAFQHEGRTSEAVEEFKLMLQEEPTGARADAVRKELAIMDRGR